MKNPTIAISVAMDCTLWLEQEPGPMTLSPEKGAANGLY